MTMEFEQSNGPIKYTNGTGSFSGYWDTINVKYFAKTETIIYWDIYVCWTGVVSGMWDRRVALKIGSARTLTALVIDFAAFHESGINNVTSILKTQGKLTGRSEKPVSF